MALTKRLAEDIEQDIAKPRKTTKKSKNIYQKLADAKAEIGAISKDSTNPFYKSKYFDINNLLAHVEPILLKHGLLCLQPIIEGNVVTQIIDIDTEQMIESSIALTDERDPQKLGSQISYFRRYSCSSILAIQAEDDDANSAKPKPQQITLPKLEMGTEAFEKVTAYMAKDGKITEVQKKYTLTETIKKILISK
jgi:hypothetical protein